jgi:hypothetical protein
MKTASDAVRRRPGRNKSAAVQASTETSGSGQLTIVRGEAAQRIFMQLLINFLHRAEHERREFYGGDLDMAAIAEAVGVAAIEPNMRDPAFRKAFANYSNVLGTERQRPINVMSVAATVGIPRETVRRKLKTLVERGILAKKDGGYVYKPGVLQQPAVTAGIERAMSDMLQFVNDCLKADLLKLVPKTARKAQAAKDRQ